MSKIHILVKLLDYPRKYSLNKADAPAAECMRQYLEEQKDRAGSPTPESVSRDVEKYLSISVPPTAEFARKYLEKYQGKVFLVRNRAERERLIEFLTRDQ
jgi:hypothetical protein